MPKKLQFDAFAKYLILNKEIRKMLSSVTQNIFAVKHLLGAPEAKRKRIKEWGKRVKEKLLRNKEANYIVN